MKTKKILAAIDAAKTEILAAVGGKKEKAPATRKKRKSPELDPLKNHFDGLADLLNGTQPNRFKIMTVVAPLVDILEKEEGIPDGLFDLLSPEARKSVVMLFLFQMLKSADEEEPAKPDYPTKVPLDVSEGDNIPQEVVEGQVPYRRKPRGKLDRGF